MKHMIALAALILFSVSVQAALKRGNETIPAGSFAASRDVKFSDDGASLDRVTIFNESGITGTVTVATLDEYVATTIYTATINPQSSAVSYPRRLAINTTSSNNVPYVVGTVRVTFTGNTNTAAIPFRWHLIGPAQD